MQGRAPGLHLVHSTVLSALVKSPGLHSQQAEDAGLLEYVPIAQREHSETSFGALTADQLPSPHGKHPVAPNSSLYSPFAQREHSACAMSAAKVPGRQIVSFTAAPLTPSYICTSCCVTLVTPVEVRTTLHTSSWAMAQRSHTIDSVVGAKPCSRRREVVGAALLVPDVHLLTEPRVGVDVAVDDLEALGREGRLFCFTRRHRNVDDGEVVVEFAERE